MSTDNPAERTDDLTARAAAIDLVSSALDHKGGLEEAMDRAPFSNLELRDRGLARMIANPDYARGLADAARQYVTGHRMLAYQVEERAVWYRSLWARRDALNQELLERVPELALMADPLLSGGLGEAGSRSCGYSPCSS